MTTIPTGTVKNLVTAMPTTSNIGSAYSTSYIHGVGVGPVGTGVITGANYGISSTGGYTINTAAVIPGAFTIGTNLHNATSVVTFYNNKTSNEIVRMNNDGTITWNNGINIDEAAEAFGSAISLGAEMQVGITRGVKHRMRDSVFADLIEIAREKGPLSADDLTYLLEASKIVEKLKGGKE